MSCEIKTVPKDAGEFTYTCKVEDKDNVAITDLTFKLPPADSTGVIVPGELDGMYMIDLSFDLEFSKGIDRDESVFGKWNMKINSVGGANAIAGSAASSDEALVISAPVFKNKIATVDDYLSVPVGDGY